MQIGIIDYGAGNLQSVRNALHALGHDPVWIRDAADLEKIFDFRCAISDVPEEKSKIENRKSNVLILPGQGEFGDSVRNLQSRGLWDPLRDWIEAGNPYFGICLGYQILFDSSEEAPHTPGLGIFKGTVKKFPAGRGLKIPHMGWNELTLTHPADPLWTGLPPHPHAYFVHSYYPAPDEPDPIAACTTDYDGVSFVSAIHRDALFACQCHPEKSQTIGLAILKNYLASVSA